MCSGAGDWTCLQPGFPIRKSSDHSLVIDSPRLIADSYVLLRFLVPRHPPCALKNLTHYKDARVHCEVLKIQPAPHTRHRATSPRLEQGPRPEETSPTTATAPTANDQSQAAASPDPSGPNNVSGTAPHPPPRSTAAPARQPACTCETTTRSAPTNRCSTLEHPLPAHSPGQTWLCHHQTGSRARCSLERR